jgi:phosphoribosylglycinamide formyltransferase-1
MKMAEVPAHATGIAILASGDRQSGGGGSTMERFICATQSGEIDAEVGLVICNNPRGTVGVYDRVDSLNAEYGLEIEVLTISGLTHPKGKQERGQTLEEASGICSEISVRGIERVLCLGYMKAINGELMEEFGWKPEYEITDPEHRGIYLARLANTHPGILPATADTHGIGASAKARRLGLPQTAHTLHVVGPGIDTGPNIAEHLVDIDPNDTDQSLFDKVQTVEKANIASAMDTYYKDQNEYLGNVA